MPLSVTLPGGYLDEHGMIHKNAMLRALTGKEEEFLADSGDANQAQKITELLVQCIQSIGTITPVTTDIAQKLIVGDRLFLLLKIREVTFGTALDVVVPCPDCQKRMDLSFKTTDIPVKNSSNLNHSYHCTIMPSEDISHNWAGMNIIYRLPNGSDQEAIGSVPLKNIAHGLHWLLKQCIISVDGNTSYSFDDIPPEVVKQLELSMEKNAPGLDLTVETQCPECGNNVCFTFALQDFFFGEVQCNSDRLYREIHYLAYHYHWSENELLSLTRAKRQKYTSILSDEIEKLNETQS